MKILYFAPVDWDFIRQRPQHLAERLASFFQFFYVQPLGLRNLKFSDLNRAIKRFSILLRKQEPQGRLIIKNLFFFPIINRFTQNLNVNILRKQIEPLTDNETIIWITSPSSLMPDLLSRLHFKALVYEMLDDYSKLHPTTKKTIIETETWLVNKADLIIVTSLALLEKTKRLNKEAALIGNGVDYDFFNTILPEMPDDLKGINKIIGYVGSIDKWIDIETITFLADNRKDLNFVFVGPSKIKSLPIRRNIHFLGKKDYDTIPHYCNFFDVCLIPFKGGEFADTINPVKLYEYFALGKPVVAYEMQELMPFRCLLYLAKDKLDFLDYLKLAMAETDEEVKIRRKEIAKLNDWSVKVKSLVETLSRL